MKRVFVRLVEQILQATPGLRYEMRVQDVDGVDAAYATFVVTNPELDLAVAIEIAPQEFRLRINGDAYPIELDSEHRVDRWIERPCRDVERLVSGNLMIQQETLFGRYLSSGVFAGRGSEWTEIADRDDGWGWIGPATDLLVELIVQKPLPMGNHQSRLGAIYWSHHNGCICAETSRARGACANSVDQYTKPVRWSSGS